MFTTLMTAVLAADVTFVPATDGVPGFIEFTGIVERGDARAVRALSEAHDCKLVLIASPGGSAYEGLKLFDVAESLELSCVSYGFGAWSAAAMFWMGGTGNTILPNSQVGFHFAYDGYTDAPAPQWWHATVGARVSKALNRGDSPASNTSVDVTLGKWQQAYDTFGTAGFYVIKADDKGEWSTTLIDSSSPTSSAPVQVREFMKAKRQTLETK